MFSSRSFAVYRRFSSTWLSQLTLRSNPAYQPFGSGARHSSTSRISINERVREAVKEFIETRKVELKEYLSTNPPDNEDVKQLLVKLNNIELTETLLFTSMGLDGLDEVELVLMIESKFGITLPDSDFHSVHSIADAARVLGRPLSSDQSGSK